MDQATKDEIKKIVDDFDYKDPPQWKIAKAEDYWLILVEDGGFYRAECKFDGCINFYRYFNLPYDPDETPDYDGPRFHEYIHYCEIDEEIDRLQRLKKIATEHFQDADGGHGYVYWPVESGE